MEIAQYSIVLVDLGTTDGSEMQKTRPCVVVSPDEMNRYLRTIVVAPMTTKPRLYPTRISVRHHQRTGWIALDQITTIDRIRIKKVLGTISRAEIRKLKAVIRETYVD